MYNKYIISIVKDLKKTLAQMTSLNIHETIVRNDQRPETHYNLSYSVKFKEKIKNINGTIYFNFSDLECANSVAMSVASKLGAIESLEYRDDYLCEFMNTAIGKALTTLEKSGFNANFETPQISKNCSLNMNNLGGESAVIVMALDISHLIFKIVFVDSLYDGLLGKKILVVDDSLMIRQLLEKKLTSVGFDVEKAFDGVDAIEKVKSFEPDLILMDQVMPKLYGLDAILEIQKFLPNAKFIMLSSISRQEELQKADAQHVLSYLVKPINYTVLLKTITEALLTNKCTPNVNEEAIPPKKETKLLD